MRYCNGASDCLVSLKEYCKLNNIKINYRDFDFDKFTTQENLDYIANLAVREYREMINSDRKEQQPDSIGFKF